MLFATGSLRLRSANSSVTAIFVNVCEVCVSVYLVSFWFGIIICLIIVLCDGIYIKCQRSICILYIGLSDKEEYQFV